MPETITISPVKPLVFDVEVSEGPTTTTHRVTVSKGVLDLVAVDPEDESAQDKLVRESFKFLLERESSSSILSKFSLDDITKYFRDYPNEIVARMTVG